MTDETTQANVSTQDEIRQTENTNRSENVQNDQQQKRKGTTYTDKYFVGQTPAIGGVLALQGETHVQKRVTFDRFRELLCNYIAIELQEADNITCLVQDFKDPIQEFEKDKPKMPTNDEGKEKELKDLSPIDQMILKEEVKNYSTSVKLIKTNIQRVYGMIWGQCTSGLQGAIRSEEEFIKKREKFNTEWLLTKIKERLSGIYKNQNQEMAIRESLLAFLNIRQYDTESNSSLLDRFESKKEALYLIAGKTYFAVRRRLRTK